MTSLQQIASRRQKTQNFADMPADPVQTSVGKIDTSKREEWLMKLFPAEAKDTLRNFAVTFQTEADMETRALAVKRDGRDLKSEVAGWSYVESKHQTLKSKSKKPAEVRPAAEEEKKEVPVTVPPPQFSTFHERRGHRGYRRGFQTRRGYQGRGYYRGDTRSFCQDSPVLFVGSISGAVEEHKEIEVAAAVQEPIAPAVIEAKTAVSEVVEEVKKEAEPIPEQDAVPVSQPAQKPYPKPRQSTGPRKWVKKTIPPPAPVETVTESKPLVDIPEELPQTLKPLVKPEESALHLDEVSMKEAEANAHKMTLDLVDHSDESSDLSHQKSIGVQTETGNSPDAETQTDEELIWRNGIPCMLVPLSAVPGYSGVIGNLGKLFGS